MPLSVEQQRLLCKLVIAAKLSDSADGIVDEFQRPAGHKQAATVQNLRTLLDRLGTTGPLARQSVDLVLPQMATAEPMATLGRFLDVYAQGLGECRKWQGASSFT